MPAPEPPITVASLGERALVARIHARVPPAPAGIPVGIGDDAAVVEPDRGALTAVTTDTLVEGVHFDPSLGSAADAGHKALAASLSDLAAMGALPRHALLALSLPASCPVAEVDALVDALLALAARHRTALIGGDVTSSPGPLVIGVTAMGSVRRRRVLRRDTARPGDIVYVSGTIGGAAAGLAVLQARAATPAAVPSASSPAGLSVSAPPGPSASAPAGPFASSPAGPPESSAARSPESSAARPPESSAARPPESSAAGPPASSAAGSPAPSAAGPPASSAAGVAPIVRARAVGRPCVPSVR